MSKTKLTDLNNHLMAQIERLNNQDLSFEEIQKESVRANAINSMSSQMIMIAKTAIDAMKLVANSECDIRELPEMIGVSNSKEKNEPDDEFIPEKTVNHEENKTRFFKVEKPSLEYMNNSIQEANNTREAQKSFIKDDEKYL